MTHAFEIADALHEVWLARTPTGYRLHLQDDRLAVALQDRGEHMRELLLGDRVLAMCVATRGDEVHVHLDGETHTLRYVHSLERFASQAQDASDAASRAPMPGAVIAIPVQVGQRVARGDVLMVIESMKMETAICAALDGDVQAVHLQVGQTFERDALLVTLTAEKATP